MFLENILEYKNLFFENILEYKNLFLENILEYKNLFLENILEYKNLFLENILEYKNLFLENILEYKNLYCARYYVERLGSDVIHWTTADRGIPLHFAASLGHSSTVSLLLGYDDTGTTHSHPDEKLGQFL